MSRTFVQPPATPGDAPDQRPLATRARAAATTVAAIVVVASFAAVVSAHASPDPSSTAAQPVTVDTDPPPPLPEPGEMVGVLDLFGRPLLGPDGQPLTVPLRPPSPRVPANAGEVHPPGGDPATPELVEVDLLTAHARTLGEVANDEHYTLVQRFDLFLANGLVAAAGGQTDGVAAYRDLLASLDQQVAAGQTAAACTTASTAGAQSDGLPTDLIGGASRQELHDEVARTGDALGCPV